MAFPLWGTIKSYILGAWSWLDDPIEGLWDGFRAKILGTWSWLNSIDDTIYGVAKRRWWWIDDVTWIIKRDVRWAWSWLDDPIDGLWDGFRAKILGAWSWMNTIDDTIYGVAKRRWWWIDDVTWIIKRDVLAAWTWLNTIDDRIRDTVSSRWTWLNTIDDRIKDIAWSHIAPKLGDWFWSFVVLEVTFVSKIGYRVLSTLWNMEWDDKNKEAK